MRTREQIVEELEWLYRDGTDRALQKYPPSIVIELLLDIRDLLNEIKSN